MKIHSLMALVFFSGTFAFAHGEDTPGPHGGFIRMPGAFHTEVLLDGTNKVKVYLLDLHWQNPSVKNSKVSATFKDPKESKAKCEKQADAFVCTFDRAVDLKGKGTLLIEATREKQKGNVAEYTTPLKL